MIQPLYSFVRTHILKTILTTCCFTALLTHPDASETVLYSQGFESDNGGYTHTGAPDMWEWGTPSPDFSSGPAAHSGSKCWGTNLLGNVPLDMDASLVSPAITLPSIGANQVMRVRFFGWIAVDFMADRGQFQISTDKISWDTKADLLLTMQGGWSEYYFDISNYANKTIYLRFRCYTDNTDNFAPPEIPFNMAGFYVDDIAITVTDAPQIKKTLTFEGNENQSSTASCPWIFIDTSESGKDFIKENDIYSTARGISKQYTDYYQLNNFIYPNNQGKYVIKLKETEDEESFTDLFQLIVVDHGNNVKIAVNENGNVYTYKDSGIVAPTQAVNNKGKNVLSRITDRDEIGCQVYDSSYVDLDFSRMGNPSQPIFLLAIKGYEDNHTKGTPISQQPMIKIQTQNASGQWVTRNISYPRWKWSMNGYDMTGNFPYSKKIRLLASSCLTNKYHLIDWAVMYTKAQKEITITELSPESAVRSDGVDVTAAISAIDGNNVHLCQGEKAVIRFNAPAGGTKNKRDFIIKSRGYYIPTGTYFFYTWDGTHWVQRDGWSITDNGDQTREFDLSLWQPDPEGVYKVRIWQDYFFDPASIDYVGLRRDNQDLIMSYATDLRNGNSILNLLNTSDNQSHLWDWGEDWGVRNRWVEIGWVNDFVNTPPSTNPVFVTNTASPAPTINWTYTDIDGNPQKHYEIEVWSQRGGLGSNLWDPPSGTGSVTAQTYGGTPLENGVQYYARVRASDSLGWGTWSEAAFMVSSNHPPVAEAGHDTIVYTIASCLTSVPLDGSASYDPDGDPLTFTWTGPFGTLGGPKPAADLGAGTFLIRLIVSDGNGGTGTDSVTITLQDTTKPVPDVASLPQITGNCSVILSNPPTATDNCAGTIIGTTDSLEYTTTGTHPIIWRYDDGFGNVTSQSQVIIVTDNQPPVPDSANLPDITGDCAVEISEYPTATDNCDGTITGTTTDSLVYKHQGTRMITWTFRDNNGNVVTQQQRVIVTDNTAPVPDVESLPVINEACAATITVFPTATDNCAGKITGTTTDSLAFTSKGTHTITWRYDDGSGNISTQTQTVILADNIPPVPDMPVLPTISGACMVSVPEIPTATDNCTGSIAGTTADPLVYSVPGTFTITWIYNDGNGNTSTQVQTIVVADNTPPVPDAVSLLTIIESCDATINVFPTATDACAGTIVGTTTDPLSFTTSGSYTITWRYDDRRGNVATQVQSVIIADNSPPIADEAQLPVITGSCRVDISARPTATDGCAGKVIGTTTDPLTYTKLGMYTVNWSYTDGNGNTATQPQTVVVIDTTKPVPDVASLPAINGSCSAVIDVFPTATDSCKGTIVATTTDPLRYSTRGMYTITWRYDDGNGNVSTQTQSVVVSDTTPPVPKIAVLPTLNGDCCLKICKKPIAIDECKGKITGTTTDPLFYDNSGTYTITWSYNDGNGNISTQTQMVVITDNNPPVPDKAQLPVVSGECKVKIKKSPTATDRCKGKIIGTTTDPLVYKTAGTYTITWTYDDSSGNVSTQTQTVMVIDTTAPVPLVTPLPVISGECNVKVKKKPAAMDNCTRKIIGTTTDPLVYTKTGVYTINWRYDDGNGNVSTQVQSVVVTDNTPPVPDRTTLPVMRGECKVKVCCYPTATDNCKGSIVGTTTDPYMYTTPGNYTITWQYNDGNGNIATQTQSVVVVDKNPPVPDLAVLPVIKGDCQVKICTRPTATDECSGRIVGKTTDPLIYTTKGTYVINWKYRDGNGNSTTQLQTVIISDTTPPVPDIAPLPVIHGNCMVTVCKKPVATDNCSTGKIIGVTSDPLTYSVAGTYTIHWIYKDQSGNTVTQEQMVIVDDNSAPVPMVNPLPELWGTLNKCCVSCCYTVKTYPVAMDNCKQKIVATTKSPLTYCKKGDFTIVWSYDDGNGNITTQNQKVHIR